MVGSSERPQQETYSPNYLGTKFLSQNTVECRCGVWTIHVLSVLHALQTTRMCNTHNVEHTKHRLGRLFSSRFSRRPSSFILFMMTNFSPSLYKYFRPTNALCPTSPLRRVKSKHNTKVVQNYSLKVDFSEVLPSSGSGYS